MVSTELSWKETSKSSTREIAQSAHRKFLRNNADQMPRTMLRYSIEKLLEIERNKLLYDSKKDPDKVQR